MKLKEKREIKNANKKINIQNIKKRYLKTKQEIEDLKESNIEPYNENAEGYASNIVKINTEKIYDKGIEISKRNVPKITKQTVISIYNVPKNKIKPIVDSVSNRFKEYKIQIVDKLNATKFSENIIKGLFSIGGITLILITLIITMIGGFISSIFNSKQDNDFDISQIPNSEIVLVAKAQIGNEGGEKFWKWYGFNEHVEWCACFVSWCANECGYIKKGIIPKFASCSDGINWFKSNDKWQDNDGKNFPMIGDIIFFDWKDENGNQDGKSDHVGIISRVDLINKTIYTIEGNSSNKCAEKMYSFEDSQIYGYGSPEY